MARALGQKRSTDFFIEILKKALFFDTINLETAKMLLLLYLTYKELRHNDRVIKFAIHEYI